MSAYTKTNGQHIFFGALENFDNNAIPDLQEIWTVDTNHSIFEGVPARGAFKPFC